MTDARVQGDSPGVRNIIVFGAGGNCVDIMEIVHDINSSRPHPVYHCFGFLDDDESLWGRQIGGVPVLGPLDSAREYVDTLFVNGIGSPNTFRRRPEVIARAGLPENAYATLIHPTAYVSRSARVGAGTVVFPNVTVNSNARLGRHVLILGNSVVSHDVVVGDYTCITGGVCISGAARIEESCYLGTNSSIIGSVRLGKGCLIGMGSVVLEDVPDDAVVVGNPARRTSR